MHHRLHFIGDYPVPPDTINIQSKYSGVVSNLTLFDFPFLAKSPRYYGTMADNKGPVLLGVTWMEVALTIVAITSRFFTQISVNGHRPSSSDYSMLLAVVGAPTTFSKANY